MNEFSRYYVELYKYIWQDIIAFFRDAVWNDTLLQIARNVKSYFDLLVTDSGDFSIVSWVMVIFTFILNISLLLFLIVRLYLWLRKFAAFRAIEIEKNELIEEIARLNDRVLELADEKNQILALKVSQMGANQGSTEINYNVPAGGAALGMAGAGAAGALGIGSLAKGPGGSSFIPSLGGSGGGGGGRSSSSDAQLKAGHSRFVKLINVDKRYEGQDTHIYMDEADYLQLPEIITRFVNFACSKLKLFYTEKTISYFFAGMAASKVMILEGISGTGKTSLPYAMAKFFGNNASIISVQPSWRDRAEIIGYLNEFTKRFNETNFLESLYDAIYRKDVNYIVLDEMNLARIEYYFAEFLSIMEMPDPTEWKIDLVPDTRPNDPLKVIDGKITVPLNVWFVGTANRDDSTYTITDKVYDRAISLTFESKAESFTAPETEPVHMSASYLQELFDDAIHKYPVSVNLLEKFKILDKYVQEKFKVAFGNRIMGQIHKFIPVFVACGGSEVEGLDFIFANKVLRKFENLNLAFLQNELDQLQIQIRKIFGKNEFEASQKSILDFKTH